MTVHKILRIGDARLRQIADPVVDFDMPELHELIADMSASSCLPSSSCGC